jgi:type I restriction enzyme S subunit
MSNKTKSTATKEGAKPTLVPKLRFPEFREAEGWPQEQLGSVATFFKGKGLPKSALTPDGKRPCIHYGELFTVYPEVIGAVRSRTNSEEDVFLSVENDVLMPTSDVTPSGLARACCLNSQDVILGGDILVIRTDKRSINGEFLARYIRHLERKVLQLVSGSTVFHLYASSMEKLVLSFPPEHAEQQKIAKCLSSVDELIAVQAQKVAALKTHKKGLMQQLFPREGETQPRLRLPEFQNAGEWESKRVDEKGNVLAGKALAVNAPGPLRPYLRTKNVLDGAIALTDVLTMPMTDAEFCRFEILDGDILLNEGQSMELVGRASIYRGEFGERCAMQNQLLRFRSFPSTCPEFAEQAFRKCQKDGTFADIATKTTSVAHLGSSRFSALELAWPPTLPEQQRIASCLSSLDALITTETQKLEALRTHKNGLMQQLFPSPEEVDA